MGAGRRSHAPVSASAPGTERGSLGSFIARAAEPTYLWEEAGEEFRLVDLNDAGCQLSGRGRSRDELLGSTSDKLSRNAARALRDLRSVAHFDTVIEREVSYLVEATGVIRRLVVSFTKVGERLVLVQIHDLTRQHTAEEQLQASEDRYRALVAAANEGVWLVDPRGRTTFANAKVGRMLGRPLPEILAKGLLDFVDEGDRAVVEAALECPLDAPDAFEARFRHADGRLLLCLLSVSPMASDPGRPSTLCVLADMTAVQRERDLRHASEDRFRRIVETANEGVWTGDAQGRTTFVNEKLAALLGTTPEDMAGRPFTEFVVDPVAAAAVKRALNREGRPLHAEARLRRVDGTVIEAIASVSVLPDDEGQPRESVVMITDVTQLKRDHEDLLESRERFAQIFEESPVGMCFITAGRLDRGRFAGANRAFRDMVGRSEEELRGHTLWSLTHSEDAIHERGLAHELFEGESATYELDKRYVRPDGTVVWARFRAKVLRDERGAPLYGLGVAVDITAQKEAGRAAGEAAELARAAEERFSRLFVESAAGILLVDLEGRVIDVNPAFSALAQRPATALIGRSAGELLSDGGSSSEPASFLGDPGSLEPVRAARNVEAADGRSIIVQVTASVVRDGSGVPLHWVCQCVPHGDPEAGEEVRLPSGEFILSYRERQVLGLLARGLDGPAIADRLGLAPETVRSYGQSAREKLGARTRTHAVAIALARREISL